MCRFQKSMRRLQFTLDFDAVHSSDLNWSAIDTGPPTAFNLSGGPITDNEFFSTVADLCMISTRTTRHYPSEMGLSIWYMHTPPVLRGLLTIPLGYKKFWTLLDAVFVSHPIGYLINPHWISFPPPLDTKIFVFLTTILWVTPLENLTIQPPLPHWISRPLNRGCAYIKWNGPIKF